MSTDAASGARAQRGFSLIEVMISMAVTIIVLLANLSIINTVQRNLGYGRALTAATNLATGKINDLRAMTVAQIKAAAPTVQGSPNPLGVRWGSDTVEADGVQFARTWTVSDLDVDGDAAVDMAGDLVKVKLDVTWDVGGRSHGVSMATCTTGKPQE